MKPTEEQQAVIDACRTGDNIVVEAGAGAGKTNTLRLAADAMRGRVAYLAYNRAAKDEAAASFPRHVRCSTIHGLAYGALGREYAHRLNAPRLPARESARRLGVRNPADLGAGVQLTPASITRLALNTVTKFCQSADPELTEEHVPSLNGMHTAAELGRLYLEIMTLRRAGQQQEAAELRRLWDIDMGLRRDLAAVVLPVARRVWADVQDTDGDKVWFRPDHYLKAWQLTDPRLNFDVVMLDEAQDSNPVTTAIVLGQDAQLVAIGDGCQQLYSWRGAVDALATWPAERRLYLTQSWRFGPKIAEEANKWLALLNTPLRLRGNPHAEFWANEVAQATEPEPDGTDSYKQGYTAGVTQGMRMAMLFLERRAAELRGEA